MNESKIIALIRFANRSRSICYKQTLAFHLSKNKVGVILYASDASENTINSFITNFKNSYEFLDKSKLGDVVSKTEVSIIGILDKNIAKEIVKLLKEE